MRLADLQEPIEPQPTEPEQSSPIVNTFIPFDTPDADSYSFEVSNRDVYNLQFQTNGANMGINGAVGLNDVLEIEGLAPGAFGIAIPDRVAAKQGSTAGHARRQHGRGGACADLLELPGFVDTSPQGGVRRCHDATFTPTVCS